MYTSMQMEKRYLLNLFLEWRKRGMKENGGGVNTSMIHLVQYMNLYKCHSVPLPSIIIKFKNACKGKGRWKTKSKHYSHEFITSSI
jgi:hypothetical protein